MAKKWSKRRKAARRVNKHREVQPDAMFNPPASARSAPASGTPLADHLDRGWPGVDGQYVVLPRTLAESMPLPWQHQLVHLFAQFHDAHAGLAWPAYRVSPARSERLVNLDEEQLAEAGYLVEMDTEGEMIYRERSGRKVDDPENTSVLVSCLDPIVRQEPPRSAGQAEPAPMNIGPQPVWRTTAPPTTASEAPPLPPPPMMPSLATPATPAETSTPANPDRDHH